MSKQNARGGGGRFHSHRPARTPPWWVGFGWTVVRVGSEIHGWRQFRSGFVSCAFSIPVNDRTGLGLLNAVEREINVLERATRPKTEGGTVSVADPDLAKKCPSLAAHLCQAVWEDGEPRQVSTLSVFTGDGAWKACLRDRELGLCLWVAAKCYSALPGVLEAALTNPETVWRVDRQVPGAPASRRKK